MAMSTDRIERQRPVKQFRVVTAYGPYRKGDLIQPTGMYRDVLVRRGVIEEVKDPPQAAAPAMASAPAAPESRGLLQTAFDRMVPNRESVGAPVHRKRGGSK